MTVINVCYRIRLSCGQPRKCSIPVESESDEEEDESPEHKGAFQTGFKLQFMNIHFNFAFEAESFVHINQNRL